MINTVHFARVCGCDDQTDYECGGLGFEYCEHTRIVSEAQVILCEGRHEISDATIDGSIFEGIVDPTSPLRLETQALKVIKASGVEYLTVYVTGLTVATIAVVNACHRLGVNLRLMHYNKDTGKYFQQPVS